MDLCEGTHAKIFKVLFRKKIQKETIHNVNLKNYNCVNSISDSLKCVNAFRILIDSELFNKTINIFW